MLYRLCYTGSGLHCVLVCSIVNYGVYITNLFFVFLSVPSVTSHSADVVLSTVKSCIKAAAYVRFFAFSGRLVIKTGICATVVLFSSIHSAEHACRESTFVSPIHDFPYNTHNKMSQLQAALLFKSGLCVGLQLQKCGFYSRAPFIQYFALVL